jgi:hypothetical protein
MDCELEDALLLLLLSGPPVQFSRKTSVSKFKDEQLDEIAKLHNATQDIKIIAYHLRDSAELIAVFTQVSTAIVCEDTLLIYSSESLYHILLVLI